jgi:hypothetical protein
MESMRNITELLPGAKAHNDTFFGKRDYASFKDLEERITFLNNSTGGSCESSMLLHTWRFVIGNNSFYPPFVYFSELEALKARLQYFQLQEKRISQGTYNLSIG